MIESWEAGVVATSATEEYDRDNEGTEDGSEVGTELSGATVRHKETGGEVGVTLGAALKTEGVECRSQSRKFSGLVGAAVSGPIVGSEVVNSEVVGSEVVGLGLGADESCPIIAAAAASAICM